LAFAPKYDYPGDLPKKLPIIRQQYLDQLYPLPGSKEEVHSINKIIGGQVFIDENATEHNFKQNAGKYDILHLAMHTIVDTDDPMYTKMVFTQTNDSVEDNFLNTYELYNMNLSARMAVLSSCNTGKGRLQKGEGVISLARGFMYAGCPSVTMSLWEVEDKSGSILMKYYYEFLKKGESKAEALQSAKLKFLDGADPLKSHPYFWSGFVVIGNHDSLFRNNLSTAWMYGVILLMTLTGAGLYFRYRKQHHNNAKR
jgi:CHAT domain-containing protein